MHSASIVRILAPGSGFVPIAVLGMALCLGCSAASNPSGTIGNIVTLQGSGASFPAPLYGRWFKEYSSASSGVRVDYQAKGSGGGIKDFIEHTVDFAASDAAMDDAEIARVAQGVVLLPMTAGSVVLAYNLPGMSQPVRLSRAAYTKMFLGQIEAWNDPILLADNPNVEMPELPITVVRRADSSGTTYVFTSHLSAISGEFLEGPGVGKSVTWPQTDRLIAAPRNDGVAATIKQTPGAIGYIEYGYADQAKLPMAVLENKAGHFVSPTLETTKAALAGVQLPDDLRVWLPDPPGEQAYPIVSYTWLLSYAKYDDPSKAAALKKMLEWCLTEGQKSSAEMGYIPLPDDVVRVVSAKLAAIQ